VKLGAALRLRCPVCGKGKIFRSYLDTPDRCPECGFYFMRETGYFLPHAPIGYLLFVFVALLTWIVTSLLLKIQSDAIVLVAIIVVPLLFSFWGNRYTKMLWMLIDLTLHPPSSEDYEARGRNQGV